MRSAADVDCCALHDPAECRDVSFGQCCGDCRFYRTPAETAEQRLLAERASTADYLNTCLRESGLASWQVEPANLKPGIDALYLRLGIVKRDLDALRAEQEKKGGHA